MNSLQEDAAETADSAVQRRALRTTNWGPIVAIIIAIISMAVSGLTSYGHEQSDLRVKAAVSVTQPELQPFRDKDNEMSIAIGVLQSQRVEDVNRLIRIEEKVDKLLQAQPDRLRTRSPIPNAQSTPLPR